jgi:DNA-binding GntR family transcriptional regulator
VVEALANVEPIDVHSYTDRVRTRLRDLLVSGSLPTGQWLRLGDLAKALGTSTTPVRVALSALEHDGLVEVAKGRGFRALALSAKDIYDTYLINGFLVGELTGRAAQRADDDLIRRCDELLNRMEAVLGGHISEDIDDLNWRFHREIHLHARAPRFERMLRISIRSVPHNFRTLIPDWTNTAMVDHRKILQALADRDAERAAAAAKEHIALGCKLLLAD